MNINSLPKKPILIEAPIWKRIFAFIVDYFILSTFILFPFDRLIENLVPEVTDINSIFEIIQNNLINAGSLIWITVIMGLISIVYFAIFESKYAQTPGKMLMRIFAVTLKSNKKELQTMTFSSSVVRSISFGAMYFFPILFLFDLIYAFFNKSKQRLFEKISGSQTLQVEFI